MKNSSILPEEAAKELLKRDEAAKSFLAFTKQVAIEPEPAKHHLALIEKLQDVVDGKITRLMVFMPPGSAKALALDTKVPTPGGWSTMGQLSVGDEVFDDQGKICKVTWKSPVYINRPCYKVVTDCGDEIIADQDHDWLVRLCGKRPVFKLKETWELCKKRAKRPMITRGAGLDLPETKLPVDPYFLGIWLGDGNSQGTRITSSQDDLRWLRQELERIGYKTTDQSVATNVGVVGVRSQFVSLGLLNGRVKHIPDVYMRSSFEQRLSLLQGLVDSDGTVCKKRGCTTFCNTNKALAEQVRELVRSLGVKAGWSESPAVLYGKACGTCYRVSFYLANSARMPRKLSLAKNQYRTPNTYIDVEKTESTSTVCIEVDSDSHMYLCGESMTPTHNSTYCSILLPAFYLGAHSSNRVISGSYDTGLSTLFGRRVRNIVSSPDYQRIFPVGVSRDSRAKGEWDLESSGGYYATGVGSAVTGRRGNLGILDDLIKGRKDADSKTVRDSTWEWYKSDFRTRLIPDQNAIVYVTTRWHEDDPAGRILPPDWDGRSGLVNANDGETWYVLSVPAEAQDNDPIGRKPGEWLWPEWFSPEFWKQEKVSQGPRNWSALYQQLPSPDTGTYFKREWFNWYKDTPKNLVTYQAGDFAVTEGGGDYTEIGCVGIDENDDMYVAPHGSWYSAQTSSDKWIDALLDLCREQDPDCCISEVGVIKNTIEPFLNKRSTERSIYPHMVWLPHIGDKAANARAFQARASMGKVYLPDDDVGHRILNQLLAFPAGKYDDIVDVLGLIGRYLQNTRTAVRPEQKKPHVGDDYWGDQTGSESWKTL